jgi:hypothetical protein
MLGLVVTAGHLLLCLFISYGVLFTRTPERAFSVLVCLVVLLLMIRYFKGCILTPMEMSVGTSVMGRAFMLKNFEHVAIPDMEEIAVSTILLLQIIRVATLLILPANLTLE